MPRCARQAPGNRADRFPELSLGQGLLSLDPEWTIMAHQRPLVMPRLHTKSRCGNFVTPDG